MITTQEAPLMIRKAGMRGFRFSLLMLMVLTSVAPSARADLLIYHLDVGMGDATLIVETSQNRTLLVDAGNRGYGKRVIAPLLKDLGYTHINYFIATHYDADHIGGFDELEDEGIEIDLVLDRGDYTTRQPTTPRGNATQYGEYLGASTRYGRRTLNPTCNEDKSIIDLGAARVKVVAAGGEYLRPDCTTAHANVKNSKDNDLSIALCISYEDFSYFVGGDLTGGGNGTADMETLIAPVVGDVDALKLNHHGSETSSNVTFLHTLLPEVAIVSVGDGGANRRYRLPRQPVLNRVADLPTSPAVFLTNGGEGGSLATQHVINGHIVVHTNGQSYTVNHIAFPVDERSEPLEANDI